MLVDKLVNEPSEDVAAALAEVETLVEQGKQERTPVKRAGITTNKGHGTSKARRKMAKASRKINRRAA
ncbi:MAG: hypothetical protein KAX65_00155 [Caldilineaceae bacterium]|nr:hypothetical protein [Caldilineaceae bacterium]